MSMMATSSDELLTIHCRYPVLAFLLSLCNPSTILTDLHTPKITNRIPRTEPSARYLNLIGHGIEIPGTRFRIPLTNWLYELSLHILATCAASMILYQAFLLGIRGVIVFACWTWHEPFTWIVIGALVHLIQVIVWRLCLAPSYAIWSIARAEEKLEIRHIKVVRFNMLVWRVFGLMNYGYGTVLLSGTTLVSPKNALAVICLLGFSGVLARLIAIWVLEVYPDNIVDETEEDCRSI
jgi:hypothetical protein